MRNENVAKNLMIIKKTASVIKKTQSHTIFTWGSELISVVIENYRIQWYDIIAQNCSTIHLVCEISNTQRLLE